jgi:hypothetical protein
MEVILVNKKRFALVAIALIAVLLLVSACATGSVATSTNTNNSPPFGTNALTSPSRQPDTSSPTQTSTTSPGVSPFQTSSPTSSSTDVTPSPTPSPAITPTPEVLPVPSFQEVFGQVVSLATGNTSIDIQKDDGSQVTINVGPDTRYFVWTVDSAFLSGMNSGLQNMMGWGNQSWEGTPSDGSSSQDDSSTPMPTSTPQASATPYASMGQFMSLQLGSFADIAVGDLVLVKQTSTSTSADIVFIVKFADPIRFIQGMVSDVSANSITINSASGNNVTLGWDSQSKVMLVGAVSIQAGQRVSCVYDSGANMIKLVLVRTTVGVSPVPTVTPTVTPTPTPTTTPTETPTSTTTGSPTSTP